MREFGFWKMLLLVLVAASGCSKEEKAQLPKSDNSKASAKAVENKQEKPNGNSVNEYRILGQVSSQEKILLSFKVNGLIRKLYVKPGVVVKKGQVVADLDDVQLQLRADSARLQLDKATNERAKAERDFKVEKDLHDKDISSLTQFQNAELTYKNAVLAQDMAEVEFKTANQNLADSKLSAPVDGTISQQFKFAGDKSDGATFEMFALADPEIYLNAPESLLSKLSVGTSLDLSFPSIEVKRKAQIVRIVPAVRESDRSFLVVARLKERDPLIVPGIFAEALVTTPRK